MEAGAAGLLEVSPFGGLPAPLLLELASQLVPRSYAAGEVVIAEGELADALHLVVEGRVEVSVWAGSPGRAAPLAVLSRGDVFGEIALRGAEPGKREATVTALTPLRTLALSDATFDSLAAAHPELDAATAGLAERRLVHKFLKQATPFTSLGPEDLARLAGRLQAVDASAGDVLLREGEAADVCYLLRRGRLEVLAREGDSERRLATLGPGSMVGETALLTGGPRGATVRALEDSSLLALRRADLLEAIGSGREAAARVVELVQLRGRPSRRPGVEVHERVAEDGEAYGILKDRSRGAYYRLSSLGLFLWRRLDGRRGLRDLTLDAFYAFGSLAPQVVVEVLAGLSAAGFLETRALSEDVVRTAFRASPWLFALGRARRLVEWRVSLEDVDRHVTRLYRGGVRHLYTRPGQVLLAALALAGLLAFLAASGRAREGLLATGPRALLWLLPAHLLALLAHEAGHAFTTKAFGREVPRAGVGWYWFSPVAFVDTSDMWLAGRWPRVAVSLAGPYANLLFGSACGLGAYAWREGPATAALWQLAAVSYVMVLVNLNPLLEYDGYYVLMDLAGRPNLRAHALRWLASELPAALREGARLRSHGLELLYGLASVVYVAAMGLLTLLVFRLTLAGWLAGVLPAGVAAAAGWLSAAAVSALCLAGLVSDLGARGRQVAGGRLG